MKLVGLLLVLAATFGGLVLTSGMYKALHLVTHVILPALPGEGLIIMGCAIAAFIVANPMEVVIGTGKNMGALVKPAAHGKADYTELLSLLFVIFKLARTKGWLALEQHIENPSESALFQKFPHFASDHHAVEFICDYLRIISLGNEDPHRIEGLMEEEIETIAHHAHGPGHAMQTMADGIPALGIVAAVLGVIKTMASITEPPEVLGHLIGGALVGTFLGVWLSYGMVAPIAGAMTAKADTEVMYYKAMRVGLVAFLHGAPPQVAVEFARKFLPHGVRPGFLELEEKLGEVEMPGG
jgi:chemotaxis protein MotA